MVNPLLHAAEPLIIAVGEARLAKHPPDLPALQRKFAKALQRFAQSAADNGVTAQQVDKASQILRLFIDESLAAAPWADLMLISDATTSQPFSDPGFTAHTFIAFLAEQVNAVDRDQDLLEFLYLLLVLGIKRGLSSEDSKQADLEYLIAGLRQTIERDPARAELVLSSHWKTRVQPRGPRLHRVPPWVAVLFAGVVLLTALQGFRHLAHRQAEALTVELEFIARPLTE